VAKPDATDEQLVEALDKALLSEFLDRLPNGLDTVLDPRGKGLSAGERQRICIARMLLKNSPIILLDEPWSNLDDSARFELAQMLNSLRGQATLVMMTHEYPRAVNVDHVEEIRQIAET